MSTAVDRCKGCRTTYNAVVRAIASNNIISILFAGIPNYILISFAAAQFYVVQSLFASASYTIMSILLLAWILAIISALRTYPNLLSVSIFVYKCLAHWSLVSLLIVAFYGWQFVAMGAMGSLLGTLFPLIMTLYVCGDVLDRLRARLLSDIERQHAATVTEGSFSGATASSMIGMAKDSV